MADGRAHDVEQLLPQVEGILGQPVARAETSIAGTYAGHRTTVALDTGSPGLTDATRPSLEVRMEGRVYDLECVVSPPALLNRCGQPLGDPEFDERFDVVGNPPAVIAHLFGPAIRAQMKQDPPASIRFERDALVISLGHAARSLESLARQLELGARLIASVPDAMHAGGAAVYLALGSLATHPERGRRITLARDNPRARTLLTTLVVGAVGVVAAALVALAVIGWWLANHL
jgi:hypothetical protein